MTIKAFRKLSGLDGSGLSSYRMRLTTSSRLAEEQYELKGDDSRKMRSDDDAPPQSRKALGSVFFSLFFFTPSLRFFFKFFYLDLGTIFNFGDRRAQIKMN